MRNVVVLEFDPLVRCRLCQIINGLKLDVKIYCAQTTDEAYQMVIGQQIHLLLIDAIFGQDKPGNASGVEFAQQIRGIRGYEFIPVIFLMCSEELGAFAYSRFDGFNFIEKPLDENRAIRTIRKALEFPVINDEDRYICFRNNGITYSICIGEIYYITVSRQYVTVYYKNGELQTTYRTCKEILQELGSASFVQCSRNTIVNKMYIEHIDDKRCFIKLKNVKDPIEIGSSMKHKFRVSKD